jgi:hypothetical protein
VFVVPAFEMNDFTFGVPENKEELLFFAARNRTKQVHKEKWSPAHGPTNYELWYKTNDIYKVQYQEGYEPYIFCRKDIPL